jgi:hypothetical protein
VGGFVLQFARRKDVAAFMNDYLAPKRLSWRDFQTSNGAATAGFAPPSGRSVSGGPARTTRIGSDYSISALASPVTILHVDHNLAAQLGDGKETDGMTNRPDDRTDPALFAGPHAPTFFAGAFEVR